MTSQSSMALAVREDYSGQLVQGLSKATATAIMRTILGPGEQLSFSALERLRVPTGGAVNWEMPDKSAQPTFSGVVLHRQMVRAYWIKPFSGGGDPPDCFSMDGVDGIGDPGGACNTCPMDRWGSARGEREAPRQGKACRQLTRLYFMTPGSVLPILLTLPPSSYQEGQSYALRLAAKGRQYWTVETEVRLVTDKSRDGITYSQVRMATLGALTPEAVKVIEKYRGELVPLLTAQAPRAEEAESE